MRVIGTAGHVDHGKSTLVQALTGIHPDRLKEEREREMTIDLGFAWLQLPDGEEVGIVDVPGHRDFIENMLAGVAGIDAAVLVIAADEGIMPQTREHLAILDLLQIPAGIVVLTKIDMVDDPEWLDLVEDSIRDGMQNSLLADAPILRVSARTGQGIPALIDALQDCLSGQPIRPDMGKARLPVDRVFSMPGFGTVVTGTLSDGSLSIGDEVEILPTGKRGRVRGLQSHKRKAQTVLPGSRTAINLTGVDLDEVKRGDIVAVPGVYQPSQRFDVQVRLLKDINHPVLHNSEVKLFIGAAEVVARVRLLGVEALGAGEEGWMQLEPREPVVAMRGDRFILRRPSPGETIGGGSVVDALPGRRHKRFSGQVVERLQALSQGDEEDLLYQAASKHGILPLKELAGQAGLDAEQALHASTALLTDGRLINLGGQLQPEPDHQVATADTWQHIRSSMLAELDNFHKSQPLRPGMPREALKSKLRLTSKVFNAVMERAKSDADLVFDRHLVKRPDFRIQYSQDQQRKIDMLLHQFAAQPYATPSVKESQKAIGEELLGALIEAGRLVQVSADVVFLRETYEQMLQETLGKLEATGTISVADLRDQYQSSRKYMLGFLEHLDAIGVTVRDGDFRRLKKKPTG